MGTKFISAEKSSFDILRALKRGEPVVFVLDQFEVIDAKHAVGAHEFDCFECAIADIDAPGKTSAGHANSS